MMNREVMVEEFISLFKSNDYEDKIIQVLNKEIKEKRQNEEMLVAQMKLMRQITKRSKPQEDRTFKLSQRDDITNSDLQVTYRNVQKYDDSSLRIEVFNETQTSIWANTINAESRRNRVKNSSSARSENSFEAYEKEMAIKFQTTREEDKALILKEYVQRMKQVA